VATFKALEQSGWTEKATAYDQHFAGITDQAIGPMLEVAGDLKDRNVLDIGCGTGNLAAAALARGARVTGIDFAPTMIELAKTKIAGVNFRVGDAEALDFPDDSFDIALCAFGVNHMPEPERAITEAARVLKQGGVFVYTTWRPPEHGWDMFALVVEAIQKHGTLDVDLPPAPSQFSLAEEDRARTILTARGFQNVSFQQPTAIWTGTSGQQVLDLIYKSIVRTPMIICAQAREVREAIDNEIKAGAELMRVKDKISMRWPYLLASARVV